MVVKYLYLVNVKTHVIFRPQNELIKNSMPSRILPKNRLIDYPIKNQLLLVLLLLFNDR